MMALKNFYAELKDNSDTGGMVCDEWPCMSIHVRAESEEIAKKWLYVRFPDFSIKKIVSTDYNNKSSEMTGVE